jgi:hypothetical protein
MEDSVLDRIEPGSVDSFVEQRIAGQGALRTVFPIPVLALRNDQCSFEYPLLPLDLKE